MRYFVSSALLMIALWCFYDAATHRGSLSPTVNIVLGIFNVMASVRIGLRSEE